MSEGFSAEWLRLREPYDAQARCPMLLQRLAEWRLGRGPIRIVDLGSGTGANLRLTAPALGGDQVWTMVEWDPSLIDSGRRQIPHAPVEWRYRRLDLSRDLEQLAGQRTDLITASALIDLVSSDWLNRLVTLRRRTGAALYMVLSYDGRIVWDPADPLDDVAAGLVNDHQATDKGFGRALGPNATRELEARLRGGGDAATVARSDWVLRHGERPIQLALLAGYEAASVVMAPHRSAELSAWAERRRRFVLSGRSKLSVGHQDLLLLSA